MSAAGVSSTCAAKGVTEKGADDGAAKGVLVECGKAEGIQGEKKSGLGIAAGHSEGCNGEGGGQRSSGENVTVKDWLWRTRTALDMLQGVK